MSDTSQPIRSYQRIFRPDRRIYQIDGRRLPVPGGVPLEWLAWAFGALVAILVLSQRSIVFALVLGAIGALLGASSHGWRGAAIAGAAGFLGTLLAGVLLGWLDWPLRLIVAPALVATLAGQASPDGRPAHRYLTSGFRFGCARHATRSSRRSRPMARRMCGRRGCGSPPTSTRRCCTTGVCGVRRGSCSAGRSW